MHRAVSRTSLGLALALTLLLGGCGEGDSDTRRAGDASTFAKGDEPAVKVLDAGAEPRQRLRLDVEDGQKESTTMVMKQTMNVGGERTELPAITMPFTTEVVDVSADEIEARFDYGKPTVERGKADPAMVAQMASGLETIDGVTGSVVVTSRGQHVDSDVELPDDMPAVMASTMDQFFDQASSLSVPFPEEEVGRGARWTVSSTIELNGMEMFQVATYTLTEVEGDNYDISVGLRQRYQPGKADGFEVIGGSGSGHGRLQGSTHASMPRTSSMSSENEVTMESEGKRLDLKGSMRMHQRTRLS